ncbi:MAG TPA: hypothetical protein VFW24_08950 [Acidimicrobiales bacterium]|nr:hypothetical protein [Acidimicrobiales bacterium]
MRDNILKGIMAGVCAYELAALIAETARFEHPKTISVLTSRSRVMRGAMAAGYMALGVHVGYVVKGSQ